MKKLFQMLALLCFAALTACDTDDKPAGDGDKEALTFRLTVSGTVTDNAATAVVQPSNSGSYYFCDVVLGYVAEDFDSVADYAKARLEQLEEGADDTFKWTDILSKGSKTFTFEGLEPDSEYLLFAVGVDAESGALTSDVATTTFTTAKTARMTITVGNVTSDTLTCSVDTDGYEGTYVFMVFQKDEIDPESPFYVGADTVEEYIAMQASWFEDMPEFFIDMYGKQGDLNNAVEENLIADTEYYVAVAGIDTRTLALTTEVVFAEFKTLPKE